MIWKLAVALAAVVTMTVGLLESRGAGDGLHNQSSIVMTIPALSRPTAMLARFGIGVPCTSPSWHLEQASACILVVEQENDLIGREDGPVGATRRQIRID
jgi:hypothetical protein